MVAFQQVPAFNLTPGTLLEVDRSGIPGGPQQRSVLIVGYGGSGDTYATPTAVLGSASPFARDSQISAMLRAYRAVDPNTPITAIALEPPGGGTAATGTISVGGAPTAPGTYVLYIAGKRIEVGIDVAGGSTGAAGDIVAAINADPDVPVTAANAGGVVTVTADFAGLAGNLIPIAVDPKDGEDGVAGAPVTVVAMSGGAGTGDLAGALATVVGERFYSVISGLSDPTSLAALVTEMTRRHGATVQLLGQGFAGIAGTFAAMITEADAVNSVYLTLMGAGASLSPSWEWAAQAAAHDTLKPDPATGYSGSAMSGLDAPAVADRPDKGERDALLAGGVSTFRVSGTAVVLDRLVTTRHEDADGNADSTLLPLTLERTLQFLRENLRARLQTKFTNFKLASSDDVIPRAGQRVLTPRSARAEIIAWFVEMRDGRALVQNLAAFDAALVVEVDPADANRLNTYVPAELIRELVVIAAVLAPR